MSRVLEGRACDMQGDWEKGKSCVLDMQSLLRTMQAGLEKDSVLPAMWEVGHIRQCDYGRRWQSCL